MISGQYHHHRADRFRNLHHQRQRVCGSLSDADTEWWSGSSHTGLCALQPWDRRHLRRGYHTYQRWRDHSRMWPSVGRLQLPPVQTLPINAGSTWKYLDDGSDQGTAWSGIAFDDSAWASGLAELGYGDGGEATVVNCGPSAPTCNSGNYITTYFRYAFNVPDASIYSGLNLSVQRDDGAVVYLNGCRDLANQYARGCSNLYYTLHPVQSAVAMKPPSSALQLLFRTLL